MTKKILSIVFFLSCIFTCHAQYITETKDSVEVRVHPSYNDVPNIHRKLFGENYRKEWSLPVKLPVIKISEIAGGLTPTQTGGGHQSHSLRLEDKSGVEWVLRSVEKHSDGLAPEIIKGSVYQYWIYDNFSAQHPFSALLVPVLAAAVKVPHTNPLIGFVAHDKALGEYEKDFAGSVCLLEKREPEGDSDNTSKMLEKLDESNGNIVDSAVFFRARLLDLLIADWGRHEDQWRWVDKMKGNGKDYLVIPRDRDQALYINQGVLPKAASGMSSLSFLEGFNANYKDVNAFFFNGRKLNQQLLNSYTYKEWMQMTSEFVSALPDEILRKAVNQLPGSVNFRKDWIFETLQGRRNNMMQAMDSYYHFLYRIIDIRSSDKEELIQFKEQANGEVNVTVHQLSPSGNSEKLLFSNNFQPEITREIRLFTGKGKDSIHLNIPTSSIKVRLIGGEGQKSYELSSSKNKVDIYENLDDDKFLGKQEQFKKHLSNDTLNTQKVFSNLYTNTSGMSPTVDLRSVDGIFLGLAYSIKKEGFRKDPYGSKQKFSVLKNLNSRALILQYNAQWISVFKNTDFTIDGFADMKGNILNFFGRGNETFFDQSGDFRTYYRTNFSYFQLDPAFRIRFKRNISISAGPSFQHFKFNPAGNSGRLISTQPIIDQYDYLQKDKSHAGLFLNFAWDRRDNMLFPTKGLNFTIRMHGYTGLNKYSDSYAQAFPQISFYKSLDSKGKFILTNRTGAGFTLGKTAFYQSAFLGSQDNLLGFRKFRFAGDNLAYTNFETRITLPNFMKYFLPGKIGLIGFYDAGRVWIENDTSDTIHHGYGAGIFIYPFKRLFIRAVAGFSDEGLQPSVTLRQRF
ncbi:BamA/TamA family outer membrane protein [Pedobacter sp. P351]|uniref:BamA/TamA family outer membrane protein n=1 Tax=Pedobacter superstes TaxID=3133441 RepID=UPI0030A11B81